MREINFRLGIKSGAVLLLLGLAGACATSETPEIPRFRDVTAKSGLDHVYGGDSDFMVGGGAAAFDCNGDGRPELLLAGGAHPARLYLNRSAAEGAVAFEAASEAPGLDAESARRVTGAYPLDLDSDGVMDVFLLRFGRNLLLRGLGDCRFEEAGAAFGLPARADWTTAFAAHWELGAALPTLAVGNYVDRSRPLAKTGNCDPSYILRPLPGRKRYGPPQPLEPTACTLSALFLDWAGSGRPDLRLANDRQYYDRGLSEQLFRLEPEGPRSLTAAEGWSGPVIWGMGLAASDLDGDGRPEVAVTNMADNHLQALRDPTGGRPEFENRALELGTMAQRPHSGGDRRPSTSWHADFADFNNDGTDDLWIVKGNVDAMPEFAAFDPDSLLLGTPGQAFTEAGGPAGIALDRRGRGGVAADLDGDGRLDLVTVNRDQPATVLHNVSTGTAGWIEVEVRQRGVNAFAVGALVEARIDGRLVSRRRAVGGGHASGACLPLHFGLGSAREAEVRVTWPDGQSSDWRRVVAGERIDFER
ncbi:MAG: CRTAC1 family protein [Kiloniellales bacterium]|nr:CRTAC1 family protein [Kiloniellales bacterium]